MRKKVWGNLIWFAFPLRSKCENKSPDLFICNHCCVDEISSVLAHWVWVNPCVPWHRHHLETFMTAERQKPKKSRKRRKLRVCTALIIHRSRRKCDARDNQDHGKGGVEFKGSSRHDRNRHNRRNRRNRQNRHGCLLVLYFVGETKGGQGALQNRQNRQNHHEGYPP